MFHGESLVCVLCFKENLYLKVVDDFFKAYNDIIFHVLKGLLMRYLLELLHEWKGIWHAVLWNILSHLYDYGLKHKQFIVILFTHSFIHSQVLDYFVPGL